MNKRDAIEDMMAQAFPKGIERPKSVDQRAREFASFILNAGWRIHRYNRQERTITFALFIGNRASRKGIEIMHTISTEYIAVTDLAEVIELFTGLVWAEYERAMQTAVKHGFSK